jgi:hypothetical protein
MKQLNEYLNYKNEVDKKIIEDGGIPAEEEYDEILHRMVLAVKNQNANNWLKEKGFDLSKWGKNIYDIVMLWSITNEKSLTPYDQRMLTFILVSDDFILDPKT